MHRGEDMNGSSHQLKELSVLALQVRRRFDPQTSTVTWTVQMSVGY